jgi:hypothetical protein
MRRNRARTSTEPFLQHDSDDSQHNKAASHAGHCASDRVHVHAFVG